MSKLETPMTRAYWRTVGGVLCEEYPLVRRGPAQGQRLVDGLIVLGEPPALDSWKNWQNLSSCDIILVQAKAKRLGMHLMGQALFSRELAMRLPYPPRSVRTVAIVRSSDAALEPLAMAYGIEVFVCDS